VFAEAKFTQARKNTAEKFPTVTLQLTYMFDVLIRASKCVVSKKKPSQWQSSIVRV